MLDYLKQKCTSLALEAKNIKKYEQRRLKKAYEYRIRDKDRSEAYCMKVFNGLYRHRIDVVRPECRAAHLAYGFLKGKKYYQVERVTYTPINWAKVETLAMGFAEDNPRYNASVEERFKDWKNEAIVYIEKQNIHREQSVTESVDTRELGYMEQDSMYQKRSRRLARGG